MLLSIRRLKKTAYGKTLIFYQLHLLVHQNVNCVILTSLFLFYSFNLCNKNKSNKWSILSAQTSFFPCLSSLSLTVSSLLYSHFISLKLSFLRSRESQIMYETLLFFETHACFYCFGAEEQVVSFHFTVRQPLYLWERPAYPSSTSTH